MSAKLEVICGPMFSGKTEELIRRIRRARIAAAYVEVFTPDIDTRYNGVIVSHAERKLDGVPVQVVKTDENILRRISEQTSVVALDEAQFFNPELVPVLRRLADKGTNVIVAGLDTDYKGEPFGSMPQFLAVADTVQKLTAICIQCKKEATCTQRLSDIPDQILIGGSVAYEARCRDCFKPPVR